MVPDRLDARAPAAKNRSPSAPAPRRVGTSTGVPDPMGDRVANGTSARPPQAARRRLDLVGADAVSRPPSAR